MRRATVRAVAGQKTYEQENAVDDFEIARELLREFKGDSYWFGTQVLKDTGDIAASAGRRAALIYAEFPGVEGYLETIRCSVTQADVPIVTEILGAGPNAPREDVLRIASELQRAKPDVIVTFGGGSTIDAAKAAEVLCTLGGEIDDYFGTGLVSKRLSDCGLKETIEANPKSEIRQLGCPASGNPKSLRPHVAIQTAASSGAHLTKYSNITDVSTGQKKLIVDDAIVPSHPVFDYTVTYGAPLALTADGALDGLAHILEVFYGAVGKPYYDRLRRIARAGISLIVSWLPRVKADPSDTRAREALCLATDLGAYAIMLGGTNGAHLTSFSLVDILSHGRACALMNPYYTVFFAPAVEGPLRLVGGIFKEAGYISQDLASLQGRELGLAVAQGMFAFAKAIDFPTTLGEVKGFTRSHIERALAAARNPQLKMKLENMPIPLTATMIDDYMAPILEAAATGDVSCIRNVSA
jgi:alcohol dehydrogenase